MVDLIKVEMNGDEGSVVYPSDIKWHLAEKGEACFSSAYQCLRLRYETELFILPPLRITSPEKLLSLFQRLSL